MCYAGGPYCYSAMNKKYETAVKQLSRNPHDPDAKWKFVSARARVDATETGIKNLEEQMTRVNSPRMQEILSTRLVNAKNDWNKMVESSNSFRSDFNRRLQEDMDNGAIESMKTVCEHGERLCSECRRKERKSAGEKHWNSNSTKHMVQYHIASNIYDSTDEGMKELKEKINQTSSGTDRYKALRAKINNAESMRKRIKHVDEAMRKNKEIKPMNLLPDSKLFQ